MDSTVGRLTADRPVVIFSKSNCCTSHAIKTLISSFGANPTIYELDELPNAERALAAVVAARGRRLDFPVVFIGQELIGGDSEVMSLHVRGKLAPLLKKAGAIWI